MEIVGEESSGKTALAMKTIARPAVTAVRRAEASIQREPGRFGAQNPTAASSASTTTT